MPERDCHLPQLTAVDTVALCGELSGMPRTRAFQRAHEVLNYVGLGEVRYRAVDGFSAGARQRCKLACALVHDPDLLILDEPTNGLDPAGRIDFLALLREVNRAGIAILLSTHLLPDVQEVCDDVVVIGHGRALRSGSVSEMTRDLARARIGEDERPGSAFARSARRARVRRVVERSDGRAAGHPARRARPIA